VKARFVSWGRRGDLGADESGRWRWRRRWGREVGGCERGGGASAADTTRPRAGAQPLVK
jgi:hypothetical protein